MKYTIYLALALLLSSCSDYDYRLSDLKNEKIKLDDLPQKVRDFYLDPTKLKGNGAGNVNSKIDIDNLVCLSQSCNFHVVPVHSKITSAWIVYEKLIDLDKGITYRIETSKPSPYVIYKDKLYLTNVYNILLGSLDYSKLEITCYTLKDK